MTGFPAKLYDGKSPLYIEGVVLLYTDHLVFQPVDGKPGYHMFFSEISDINPIGASLHITTKNKENKQILVVLQSSDGMKQFIDFYSESSSNILKKIPWKFRKLNRKTGLILVLLILFSACLLIYGILYQSYRIVPLSTDRILGDQISPIVMQQFTLSTDRRLNKKIERIAGRVIPDGTPHSYSISVVESDEQNAFALPGGRIYIMSGLVRSAENDDEIAGVIAHEIIHVERRHGLRQMIRVAGLSWFMHMAMGAGFEEISSLNTINDLSTLFVFLHYSRSFEKEADLGAIELLGRAHISGDVLVNFLEHVRKSGKNPEYTKYVNSHPSVDTRIDYIRTALAKEKKPSRPVNFFPGAENRKKSEWK